MIERAFGRYGSLLVASAAWFGALGCSDGATAPVPSGDGQRLATQFKRLADSVAGGGYSPTAEALRHAAEIVRLTGHATPVTLTVDGATRSFLAVAEQIDFPNLECSWPTDSGGAPPPDTVTVPPVPPPDSGVVRPIDSTGAMPPASVGATPPDTVVPPPPGAPECKVVGTFSMRTLIAWEPENMAEVVRIVADVGSNGVAFGTPDVMTGLPTNPGAVDPPAAPLPPDSSVGKPSPWPGFIGEYLVRDEGSWWAVEGSQSNDLEGITGACTADRATFDWADFSCEAARFRFELSMRVEGLPYDATGVPLPGNGTGSHTLALGPSSIDGVRLTVVAWSPPPEPGPGPDPVPVDSTGVKPSS
jgi:hypothetical protein